VVCLSSRISSPSSVAKADVRDQSMRESFVVPVNSQRREMAGNVILYVCPLPTYSCWNTDRQFYTISSGFRLRTPMPPYLPPAEKSRQRLVEGIRGLDVVKRRSVRGGGRHLLFFAYALAMQVSLFFDLTYDFTSPAFSRYLNEYRRKKY